MKHTSSLFQTHFGSAIFWLLFLLSPSRILAQSVSSKFQISPSPSWALLDPQTPSPAPWDGAVTPWVRLLDDHQIRVTPGGLERYSRNIDQALSETGTENLSKLYFCFDPSSQKLAIHHIRLLRGKQTLDVLEPDKIVEAEEEDDDCLEANLKEVRKGDIIDYAYSLTEAHAQGGRFAETLRLGRNTSTDRLRRRILWPAQLKLYMRTRNTAVTPSVRSLGREVEYLWEPELLAPSVYYPGAPLWFDLAPQVQLSDFASWQQVAQLAASWYRVPNPLPDGLANQVEEWRARFSGEEARLLAAARFVQTEIHNRYGQTQRPAPPALVFEKREGSSYDAALLLCTLLRGLGIEATPALVNPSAQHVLEEYQPSLAAFNSAVVRVSLGDRTYWFDPTKSHQRGPLRQHPNPAYAKALILRPDSQGLVEISPPATDASSVEVKEIYQSSSYRQPVTFQVITTYRGIAADDMREQLSWLKPEDFAKQKREHYSRSNPNLAVDGQPQVSDDPDKNQLIITERYHFSKFWRGRTVGFQAEQVDSRLQGPVEAPLGPLELDYPMNFRQIIEVHAPEPHSVSKMGETLQDDALRFSYSISAKPPVVTLDYRLQSLRSFVPAEDVQQHLRFRAQLKPKLAYELSHSGDPLMLSYVIEYWPFALLAVFLIIGLCLLLW